MGFHETQQEQINRYNDLLQAMVLGMRSQYEATLRESSRDEALSIIVGVVRDLFDRNPHITSIMFDLDAQFRYAGRPDGEWERCLVLGVCGTSKKYRLSDLSLTGPLGLPAFKGYAGIDLGPFPIHREPYWTRWESRTFRNSDVVARYVVRECDLKGPTAENPAILDFISAFRTLFTYPGWVVFNRDIDHHTSVLKMYWRSPDGFTMKEIPNTP